MKNKTFFIHTLGCKTNQSESDEIINCLIKKGFKHATIEGESHERPHYIIVNTCTVTSAADKKARQIIKKFKRSCPGSIVIVTGCCTVFQKELLGKIGADFIICNKDKKSITDFIENHLITEHLKETGLQESENTSFSTIEDKKTGKIIINDKSCSKNSEEQVQGSHIHSSHAHSSHIHSRALIKIQDGCEQFCSYCIVPLVRGGYKSEPQVKILDKIKNYCDAGFEEIVLTGIHIGKYGVDFRSNPLSFAGLLESILEKTRIKRIRLSSIEINEIDSRLLGIIKENYPRIAAHLHIPLQSGSDKILQIMNRKYTVEFYKAKIKEIHEIIPDMALTTDIIIGFPGETDEDFNNTLNLVNEIRFSRIHVFRYSRRHKTKAAALDGQVSDFDKNRRSLILRRLGEQLRTDFLNSNNPKVHDVICESFDLKTGIAEGTSENYIKVYFHLPSEKFAEKKAKILKVQTGKLYRDGLFGIVR